MTYNQFTLESFKKKFYEKFPNSNIKIIELLKLRKVLVKDKYGECLLINSALLKYGSCSIKAAINKTEYFINKAKEVHGDRFDYSKVEYIQCDKKVKIICPIHGEFEQSPEKHLTYKGCTQCSTLQKSKEKICSTKQFIEKAKLIHGDKYDYSKSEYVNAKEKLIIICKEHGEFLQNANNHLNGQGCPECGIINTGNFKRGNQEDIIQRFITVHNDKYDYSLVNYTHFEKKVEIICPLHGTFLQTSASHLSGNGCRGCSKQKMSELQGKLNNGWNYHLWEKKGKESKAFDSFKVYILRCVNETEKFYKIGKTFNTVERRFQSKRHLPYDYEIIQLIEGSALEMSKLEKELHKMHKDYYYTPQVYFEGNKECFIKIELELIKSTIKNL